MAVGEQARFFLAMGVCGAALGVGYDLLQLLRWILRGGRAMQAALDLAFGPICAAAMIAAGLMYRTDPFRLFAFAGAAAGFTAYMTTLGTIVRVLYQKIHSFVKKS